MLDVEMTDTQILTIAMSTEMKDLWRSELHRVEEVTDARLKHIER